jgi:hypothetical protein
MAPRTLVLALLALVVIGIAEQIVSGPVSRVRVERFARRQRLTITADNGNQVIRYLATVRRWRTAGLVAGLVLSVGLHMPTEWRFDFQILFAGWFAGALVAEARVAHLDIGPRRVASLQPRRPSSYLTRSAWALVPVAAGVAVALGLATTIVATTGAARPGWTAGLWLAVALLVAAAVRIVQIRVLRRPQPLAPHDVLAADDAVRSRSLHVLAGGGAALVLLCALAQLGATIPTSPAAAEGVVVVRTLGVFAVAALGWNVATSMWPRRSPGAGPGPTTPGAGPGPTTPGAGPGPTTPGAGPGPTTPAPEPT